jgi:hypothetical protein
LGAVLGYRLIKRLEQFGYKGVITLDLTNSDSVTASPREALPDLFTNRFAALAAGLGTLTVSGHLATPQFGLRQRCLAIVTDAPLEASSLLAEAELACETCDQPCVSTCPSQAITSQPVTLNCEGHQWTFHKIDPLRCDWSKRYALTGDSGNKFIGSPADVAPPEVITPELLSDALKQLDPIKKYRPVIAEPCVINCPLAAGEVYRQRQ